MTQAAWRLAFLVSLVMVVAAGLVAAQSRGEIAAMKNPVAASPDSIAAGEKIYKQKCQFCHGADAKGGPSLAGDGGKAAPDLTDSAWEHGSTDGEIFDSVKNGVKPDLFMEPWGDRLSDTDIWSLVNYMRSLAKH